MLPEMRIQVVTPEKRSTFERRFEEIYEEMGAHPLVKAGLERMSAMSEIQHRIFQYHDTPHVAGVFEDSLWLWAVDHQEIFLSIPMPDQQWRLIRNLGVAAAYHDTGFTNIDFRRIKSPKGHEQRSVVFFKADLEKLRNDQPEVASLFSDEDVAMIEGAILATELQFIGGKLLQPTIPFSENPIAAYLQDADMSNIGDQRFKDSTERVYREERRFKVATDPRSIRSFPEFLTGTLDMLLLPHEWKTEAARKLLKDGEEQNRGYVRKRLGIPTVVAVSVNAE